MKGKDGTAVGVIALVGTLIGCMACVAAWLVVPEVRQALRLGSSATPSTPPHIVTATAVSEAPTPTFTPQPSGTPGETPTQQATATATTGPTGESLLAGEPYTARGLAISLGPEYSIDRNMILLNFAIRNVSDQSTVISYQNGYFHVTDNIGNEYKRMCEDTYYTTKQYELEGGKDSTIGTTVYCSWAGGPNNIGPFQGIIDVKANYLIVTVDQFMGMENLQWRLDLQ